MPFVDESSEKKIQSINFATAKKSVDKMQKLIMEIMKSIQWFCDVCLCFGCHSESDLVDSNAICKQDVWKFFKIET